MIEIWADTRGFGRCRTCGAAVEWAEVVKSGKRMPFDGVIVASATRKDAATWRLVEIVDLSVTPSHFQTCPEAQAWRTRR